MELRKIFMGGIMALRAVGQQDSSYSSNVLFGKFEVVELKHR